MGFDVERFLSPVNEGLLCSICHDVLENPLQAPCEHVFCSSCIDGWLVQHNTCPVDRLPLSSKQLHLPFRYMRNDLDSLKIRCCNWGGGCRVVRCLETLPRHEETCSFVSVPCSSPGCRVMLERYELDRHLSSCEYRTKMCAKGCGLPILHQADNDHSCVAELRLSLDLLRSELINRNEEHQQEMKTMLDAQRHHLAVREATTHIRFEKMAMQLQKLGKEVVSLRQANKQKELVSLRQANKQIDLKGGGITETGK